MNNNKHKTLVLLLLLLPSVASLAQWDSQRRDTVSRLQVHGTVGAGMASGWGQTQGYIVMAPRLTYQLDSRWSLKAGFAVVNAVDMLPTPQPRSMAPRRNSSTAAAVNVGAEYRSGNMAFTASAFYLGGQTATLWSPVPYNLDAYGVSASMQYRLGDNNYLTLHVGLVRDNTGAIGRMLWENPYYCGWGGPVGYGFGCPWTAYDSGFAAFGF